MPANKSSGIDKIPVRVIKDSLPATLPVITSLINASFTRGNFSRSWKLAVVSPILKDGNHEEPNNNKPITLLPILSKVFFVFKANGSPPVESAMATRHSNLSSHLKREVPQHVKHNGVSNPAPYRHSTRQTTTEQGRTNHELKTREAHQQKVNRRVQPIKATHLADQTQQYSEPQYNQLRRPGEP